jgi:colicin import membrane protein
MHAAGDRTEFAPPPQPGMLRAFVLAVVAHLLLAVALTQGLQWQRETQDVAAEAELWAAVPQQAAPREEPTPPPPPVPVVKAPPEPVRPPVVKAPEPPVQRDADIALEREKQRRELEKRKELAAEREREREQRRKLEAQKQREEDQARKKQEQAKQLAEAKKEQAKLLAEARRKEADQKRKEQEAREARDTKRLAQLRDENMKRMQGMVGSGSSDSTGSAAKSSGPSASWGSRVQARVKPNIVFTDDVSGNPKAEVEVRMAPDGTIVGKRLVKSSGVKAWDDAVLRALDKTEVLPRDVDGRVPSSVIIDFRPRG